MTLSAKQIGLRVGTRELLRDVSLVVNPAEFVVVLGPNGAGKTSLLRLLSGEMPPQSGVIEFCGKPIQQWNARELARRRAVMTQHPANAVEFTAEEIVSLGRTPYNGTESSASRRRVVHSALKQVGASSFATRRMGTLSGGEAQRVHLARALAQIWRDEADEPRYLLLDEPFSALDVAWQHESIDLVRELRGRGIGILAIVHDLNLAAQYADQLVLLKAGKVVAAGEPTKVLTQNLIHEVFGVCATVCRHPIRSCPVIVHHGIANENERLRSTELQEEELQLILKG